MTIINASPDNIIQLGWEGEDRVTVFRFRYGEDWVSNGNGIFSVRVLRNGENQAYNAQMVLDDRENHCLLVTLTEVELSKKGTNEMQVVYSGEDFIKKSPVYRYYVSRSVDEPVDPPAQDVYTQIIESLSDLQTDMQGLADAVEDIGDISLLTTTAKTDLVSAINEVNEHGGGSTVTVDDALSATSTNPVQNKVITARIDSLDSDVGALRTSVQSKADIQTVSALSDAVNGLDSDVQGLQTTVQSKADTSTVTALSETVSGLQTVVQSKADAQMVTALSGIVTGLQTSKADKSYVDDSLASKVVDVQVNETSIVSGGVANVPIASSSNLGVSKCSPSFGINVRTDGYLNIVSANSTAIKNGNAQYLPVTTTSQHESAFYGLAKVAGHDEKNSTLPVGTYSEEAKTAIRTMLGIGTAIELREYSELGEDTGLIEIPLPEKYEKVWYRFQCRINNADNNLSNGLTQYVAWLGDSSSFGSNERNISIYNNIHIRSSDIFMIKGFFIVDFPFVERFSSEPYGATNWSAKSNLVTYDGSYMPMNRLTSYPRSLFIRPYETNKGYLFKANSMLGVYVK